MPLPPRLRSPVWLLDLDNTLHNASAHIFPHLNQAMTRYLEQHLALTRAEADALRRHYWLRYGATLLGLMRHHGTDPHHFLAETHHFEDLRPMLVFDRALRAMLRKLPGSKIVFSNGPQHYAEAVVRLIGIEHRIDDIFGIERMGFQPKPGLAAYRAVLRAHRLHAAQCIMVEDTPANLRPAYRLGMRTVLISKTPRTPAYVHLRLANVLELPRHAGKLMQRPA